MIFLVRPNLMLSWSSPSIPRIICFWCLGWDTAGEGLAGTEIAETISVII